MLFQYSLPSSKSPLGLSSQQKYWWWKGIWNGAPKTVTVLFYPLYLWVFVPPFVAWVWSASPQFIIGSMIPQCSDTGRWPNERWLDCVQSKTITDRRGSLLWEGATTATLPCEFYSLCRISPSVPMQQEIPLHTWPVHPTEPRAK